MSGSLACSVIIPTYNRRELLDHTLRALAAQTIGSDAFEVIVVDDGSSDSSDEVAKSYADRLRIRYFFQADEGYRVALARNVGIRQARAPICVFVDSGVLLHSDCLAEHLRSHARHPDAAVVGYVLCFNEDNEDAAEIQAEVDLRQIDASINGFIGDGRRLDIREPFYARYGDELGDLPAPWLMYWTCNTSARRDQLLRVGLFDENFRSWGAEDVELAYRLHRDGARFFLARAAVSLHYPHLKSYSENMRAAAANYLYFARKYETPITALVVNHHFFDINELIRERQLPSCESVMSERSQEKSAQSAEMQPHQIRGSVIVFAPHPDDEVIACGGTIIRALADGMRVHILFATDGSRSHEAVLGIHTQPTPAELAALRYQEALACASQLGVPARQVHFVGATDTRLGESLPLLTQQVDRLLNECPDLVSVYIPHPHRELNADHRHLGEVALDRLAAAGCNPEVYQYVVWDEETEREFGYSNRPIRPASNRCSAEVQVRVNISAELPQKLRALAEHRSQTELISPQQMRSVLQSEFIERRCKLPFEEFWRRLVD
jgi:LmbE family N-acetylglucosaminyl deacetylase/glycosyltransferase involved in cell wall biosynthesis